MSSSPDVRPALAGRTGAYLDEVVLRGEDAARVAPARLDGELRTHRYLRGGRVDARLVDPGIELAFEEVAERVRAQARAEGYAQGWSAGRTAAVEQVRREAAELQARLVQVEQARQAALEGALTALRSAAEQLERRAVPGAVQASPALLEAALQVAAAVLDREARLSDDVLEPVRRALDLVPVGRPVLLRLPPADAAAVRGLLADATEQVPALLSGRDVVVVDDASLRPGDCVAECDAARVDARLATAVDRVREVLQSC